MQQGKIGNKNAVGHDGSNAGRKSAYAEKADAQFLADMFFQDHDMEEIKTMLGSRRSIAKVMLAKALQGDMKAVNAVFSKLFPDLAKTDHTTKGESLNSRDLPPEAIAIIEADLKRKKIKDEA